MKLFDKLFGNSQNSIAIDNITVRPFLTIADANNKWIMKDISVVVNVSSNHSSEVASKFKENGVSYHWFPMTEENGYMGLHSIYGAITILLAAISNGNRCILHCYGGNNRSKVVYESVYYILTKKWYQEDYKNYKSVIEYNCESNYLPSLDLYQQFLNGISEGQDLESILSKIN